MQNMMLAAWNDGVASCPNGIADAEQARAALGLGEDEQIATVLTFGYPASGLAGESRSVEEWIARADRKPLDELGPARLAAKDQTTYPGASSRAALGLNGRGPARHRADLRLPGERPDGREPLRVDAWLTPAARKPLDELL